MATGESCVSLTSEKRESLTCALCVNIFRDPKLLPCSHTFCQKCLEDLIQRHHDGTFPCPACRKDIEVPADGALAFQTNFYIDQDDLDRVRNDTLCSAHPQIKLDMFCVDCDILICMDCKLDVHFHHRSQSLQDANRDAEDQLPKDKIRLCEMKEDIEKKMPLWTVHQQEFQNKKSAVETQIRYRHATVVAEADRYLNEALESLKEVCSETEDILFRNTQTAQNNITELHTIQQKIDAAIQDGNDCTIVNTAAEVRTGSGSQEKVEQMYVEPLQRVSRPIYLADTPEDDAMFISMKKFIGAAQLITYDLVDPEVKVTEQTRCGEHADSVVFCVCPLVDSLHLSFEPSYKDKEPCMKTFLTRSKMISDLDNYKGRYSCRHWKDGQYSGFPCKNGENWTTYVKCGDLKKHYLLCTEYSEGVVKVSTPISLNPFKTTKTVQFRIDCGFSRAVDINSSEELFAVVKEDNTAFDEKANTPCTSRQVKLFRHYERTAVDTYNSPLTPWQPADVCFFTLGEQEV